MNLQELFDGGWWELEFGQDIHVPYLRVLEEVPVEGQEYDAMDSAGNIGLVVVPAPELEQLWHPEEKAWGNFCVMLQAIASLLPGGRRKLVCEQRVTRDDKWNVTGSRYVVHWKGEPIA